LAEKGLARFVAWIKPLRAERLCLRHPDSSCVIAQKAIGKKMTLAALTGGMSFISKPAVLAALGDSHHRRPLDRVLCPLE
jgi:hypothetical protein